MSTFTMSVAGRTYELPPDADLAALRERLVTAVRNGGDVVGIPSAGLGHISVLISPGLPIFLEEVAEDPPRAESETKREDGWSEDPLSMLGWDSF